MKRKTLEKLDLFYIQARGVCDPIEFPRRQQNLLYAIVECLLEELEEMKL